MSGLVTKETNRSVGKYIDGIGNNSKIEDSKLLLSIIKEITGYKRKSGKEEFEWFNIGFAPRKNKITIYLNFDINEEDQLLKDLGKCKWGKGCLYINKLKDINIEILKQLILKGMNKDGFLK